MWKNWIEYRDVSGYNLHIYVLYMYMLINYTLHCSIAIYAIPTPPTIIL